MPPFFVHRIGKFSQKDRIVQISDEKHQGRPIPFHNSFQKAQVILWSPAFLFFFDCFRLYSLLYFGEYGRKQPNFFDQFCKQTRIRPFFSKKENFFSSYGGSCYLALARAPPRKSEPDSKHVQIFGGNLMVKTSLRKNSCKNFSYVFPARTLYQLRWEAESNGRAVRA